MKMTEPKVLLEYTFQNKSIRLIEHCRMNRNLNWTKSYTIAYFRTGEEESAYPVDMGRKRYKTCINHFKKMVKELEHVEF